MTIGLLSIGIYQHGPLHLNVGAASAANGWSPFLDYFRIGQIGSMTLNRSVGGSLEGSAIWSAGGYLDPATGFLAMPCPADVTSIVYYFYTNNDPLNQVANSGLAWNISWDGRGGTVVVDFAATHSIDNVNGTGTFTFQTNPGNNRITVTITDRTDPPRNFHIWQQRYDANWQRGEKFNPDFIAQAKKFYRLRLVDWDGSNITGSEMSTFTSSSQLASESWFSWSTQGVDGESGPFGLVPLSLCAALANVTGCKLHFNIPYLATDQCVTDIATFFKNNTNLEVAYEYSNEAWNPSYPVFSYCLTQGNAIWPGDGARFAKYYGYRAAQCMKIIHDVYNDTTRWSGVLATQNSNAGITDAALIGIAQWKSDNSSSLNVNDLFKGLYGTSYFGAFVPGPNPASITNAVTPLVTLNGHGFTNGQTLRFFAATGMTQINNLNGTVSGVTTNTFNINIDTSGFSAWVAAQANYCVPSAIFDMMDQSLTNFNNNPALYPTKYTYFNQQLAASCLHGTNDFGFAVSDNIDALQSTFWPAQKVRSDANGLDLNQYEGGLSFAGSDFTLRDNPGNPQFTEYLLASGHSSEIADVYAASYAAFTSMGGKHPSKYNMAGPSGVFGTWGGMQTVPETPANPVWQAVLNANGI